MILRYKKVAKIAICAAIALGACRFLLPCPIAGNWAGGNGFFDSCFCDAHRFLRFKGGIMTQFDEHEGRAMQTPYRKISWNTYQCDVHEVSWAADRLKYEFNTNSFWRIRPGWLFMRLEADGQTFWLYRDYRLSKAQSIAKDVTFETQRQLFDRLAEARSRRAKEKTQPDGAANGSQPFRLETNSTPWAAGSRR